MVGDHELDPRAPRRGRAPARVDPGSLYLTAFSTRLPSADTSWRRSPTRCSVVGHARAPRSRCRCCSAELADAVRRRRRRRRRPSTGSRIGSSPSSIRDSSSRSSIVRATRCASSTHPVDHAVDDAGIGLVDQRLGQHGQRADRRLQLVADVGDEVGAHGVDPAPLADVLDRRHRAAAVERGGGDDDGERGGPYSSSVCVAPRRRASRELVARRLSSTSRPLCVPASASAAGLRYSPCPSPSTTTTPSGEPVEDLGPVGRVERRRSARRRLGGCGPRLRLAGGRSHHAGSSRQRCDDAPPITVGTTTRHLTPGRSLPARWRSGGRRRARAAIR